ncbi:CLUMA_CG021497, isoform A [Clunio marinus]|uniref:CLUMA_CG021497, isoform A n=1 Tax=Clunio marinus TaxID=568069 RepID=A0A1J1J8B9_9DIPT|nr:CLUMA_CG021497, isoform A [Clunio marinus]
MKALVVSIISHNSGMITFAFSNNLLPKKKRHQNIISATQQTVFGFLTEGNLKYIHENEKKITKISSFTSFSSTPHVVTSVWKREKS